MKLGRCYEPDTRECLPSLMLTVPSTFKNGLAAGSPGCMPIFFKVPGNLWKWEPRALLPSCREFRAPQLPMPHTMWPRTHGGGCPTGKCKPHAQKLCLACQHAGVQRLAMQLKVPRRLLIIGCCWPSPDSSSLRLDLGLFQLGQIIS